MTTKEVRSPGPEDHVPPLTIAQAAEFLNVTERWVRRAKDDYDLPYLKLGHHVRFLAEDLRAYMMEVRVATGPGGHQVPTPSRWSFASSAQPSARRLGWMTPVTAVDYP